MLALSEQIGLQRDSGSQGGLLKSRRIGAFTAMPGPIEKPGVDPAPVFA